MYLPKITTLPALKTFVNNSVNKYIITIKSHCSISENLAAKVLTIKKTGAVTCFLTFYRSRKSPPEVLVRISFV